jgi:SAM-dependent methyltransferase
VRTAGSIVILTGVFALGLGGTSDAQVIPQTAPAARSVPAKPEVGPVPTPQPVVDKMLEMAEIKPGDVVYDLGCGDGRILVTAAKRYGVKAVGYDLDAERVRESQLNAKTNGVEHLVTVKQADVFTVELREATVVTLYLLPELNVRLMPKLEQLRPGSRIVSHDFDMRGAVPAVVHRMSVTDEFLQRTPSGGSGPLQLPPAPVAIRRTHKIYKWVVPWEKEPSVPAKPATQ